MMTSAACKFALVAALLIGFASEARVYLPREGRFLSRDRAGMIDGPNEYQYVKSNPTMYTDPSGRLKFGMGPSPDEGWVPVPSEDDSLMRYDIEYAADVALALLMNRGAMAQVRGACSEVLSALTWNVAAVANLDAVSEVWRRVPTADEIKKKTGTPNGEAGEPLGQAPYLIAVSDNYLLATPNFSKTGVPDKHLGLLQLENTLIHEWMHHVLKVKHPAGYDWTDPIQRAADLPASIADSLVPP